MRRSKRCNGAIRRGDNAGYRCARSRGHRGECQTTAQSREEELHRAAGSYEIKFATPPGPIFALTDIRRATYSVHAGAPWTYVGLDSSVVAGARRWLVYHRSGDEFRTTECATWEDAMNARASES